MKKRIEISKLVLIKEYLITNLFLTICLNLSNAKFAVVLLIVLILNILNAGYIFFSKALIQVEIEGEEIKLVYLFKFRIRSQISVKDNLKVYFTKELQGKGVIGSALEIIDPIKNLKLKVSPIFSGFKMNKLKEIHEMLHLQSGKY